MLSLIRPKIKKPAMMAGLLNLFALLIQPAHLSKNQGVGQEVKEKFEALAILDG